MRSISEYLMSKDKAFDQNYGFPTKPVLEEVVSFLESKGFKQIDYAPNSDDSSSDQLRKAAFYSDTPIYMLPYSLEDCKRYIERTYLWIRFANNGKIDDDHPQIFLKLPKDGDVRNVTGDGIIAYVDSAYSRTIKKYAFVEYDRLVEYINKTFGWE